MGKGGLSRFSLSEEGYTIIYYLQKAEISEL